MKRAVVFRTVGDADFGNAIVDGMMKPLTSDELEIVKAELERTKAENTVLGVRKVRDKKDYAKKMRRLQRKYPPVRQSCKAAQYALLAWALTWLTIKACFDRLAVINRG